MGLLRFCPPLFGEVVRHALPYALCKMCAMNMWAGAPGWLLHGLRITDEGLHFINVL